MVAEWSDLFVNEDVLCWDLPITLLFRTNDSIDYKLATDIIDYKATDAVIEGNYTFFG